MNIKKQAREFAIKAHYGQLRKSDKDKPMIVHPIDVAGILESYGFDDNVVAAGYLHDVIEDTDFDSHDIKESFGDDVLSLVLGDSEKDKSLEWEERKRRTIEEVKELDIRHKAIVAADKISNLEDLQICIGKVDYYDFSSFNRGYDKQKWYYENIYESLIYNEETIHPMFLRLKELIDSIFNNSYDEYLEDIIFEDKRDELKELKKLHYKKKELMKLKNNFDLNTFVIEFTGTPRTGKTTLINSLKDFFKNGGYTIGIIEEFTTSDYYKNELYPSIKDLSKEEINKIIPVHVLKDLKKNLKDNKDILIVDRCLFDRVIWMDRLYKKKGIKKKDYKEFLDKYTPIIKDNIDVVVATYTDPLTSIKREYHNNLSLERRRFLNEENVNEYNVSLLECKNNLDNNDINIVFVDTTNKSERDVSVSIANNILDVMRKKYIDEINEYLKGLIEKND